MPRFYRFDGSTGMDLRPAAVLEADAARIDELRRRRDSMAVATRIRMVDQPPEGLLPLSLFDRTPLPDRTALHPRTMETVAPDIAGLYVDYMTRIAMGASKRVAFRIPLLGARLVGQGEYAESLLSRMVDFAFPSARAACLLLDFDGSGDFLTGDTLWDFKVSGYPPNPRYTLQLLIYWRMGLHSVHPEYQSIRRLGFFNPRRNEVWLLDVDRVTPELIDWTDRELIGYPA